jgi:hypothetical protein
MIRHGQASISRDLTQGIELLMGQSEGKPVVFLSFFSHDVYVSICSYLFQGLDVAFLIPIQKSAFSPWLCDSFCEFYGFTFLRYALESGFLFCYAVNENNFAIPSFTLFAKMGVNIREMLACLTNMGEALFHFCCGAKTVKLYPVVSLIIISEAKVPTVSQPYNGFFVGIQI